MALPLILQAIGGGLLGQGLYDAYRNIGADKRRAGLLGTMPTPSTMTPIPPVGPPTAQGIMPESEGNVVTPGKAGSGLLGSLYGMNPQVAEQLAPLLQQMPHKDLRAASSSVIEAGLKPKNAANYESIKIDGLGNPWGLNKTTGQWVQIPSQGPFIDYQSVETMDPVSGAMNRELVSPALLAGGQAPQPRITVGTKPVKPLPTVAQDNFSQSFDALDALNQMRNSLDATGILWGNTAGRMGAATGIYDDAVNFQTARANMKLAAQALIKGVPSNFDVQTVIDTLPEIGLNQTVNKNRIDFSERLLKNLVTRTIAYYKGTGVTIPPEILTEAARRGIDVSSITPWTKQRDGDDPLAGVKEQTEAELSAQKQPPAGSRRIPRGN